MDIKSRIAALVTKTADAYSFDRYGVQEWRRATRLLIDRGLDDRQIEAILRSKWTRWAADHCADNVRFKVRGDDLIRFMDEPRNKCDANAIADLVACTF